MLEFELVLPAYNEGKSLKGLLGRAVAAARETGFTAESFQLVLVENGSTDDSAAVLAELKRSELGAWFRVVPVKPNQGYGNGLWAGLRATTAPVVGWSHADMQCDPKDALAASREVSRGLSAGRRVLVKGVRSGRAAGDRFVSRTFETFARVILGLEVSEVNAQPKIFERSLLGAMKSPPKTFAFDLYALYCALKAGFEIQTIPVAFPPRIHGVSKWASTFLGRYKTILGIIRYMWELRRSEGRL